MLTERKSHRERVAPLHTVMMLMDERHGSMTSAPVPDIRVRSQQSRVSGVHLGKQYAEKAKTRPAGYQQDQTIIVSAAYRQIPSCTSVQKACTLGTN